MSASRFPGGSKYARVRKAYRGAVLVEPGSTSPVTSFNTRTGAVTLLESDVLTALGLILSGNAGKYVKVNAAEDNLEFGTPAAGSSTSPVQLPSYTVATLPAAASYTGHMIYVSNEVGGPVPAFSDGTNWLRVTDRAIVS